MLHASSKTKGGPWMLYVGLDLHSQPNGARWPSILERAANETGHALAVISQRPHDETYLTFA
jgi:hypothetical protein